MTRFLCIATLVVFVIGCGKKKEGDDKKSGEPSKAPATEPAPPTVSPEAKAADSQARDGLAKMAKNANSYYSSARVTREGMRLECQFPASNEWTPTGSACEAPNKQFEIASEHWNGHTWSALNFMVLDKGGLQYKVTSSGTLADAKITLSARADPDCDGKFTTWTLEIGGDPNATLAECTGAVGEVKKAD